MTEQTPLSQQQMENIVGILRAEGRDVHMHMPGDTEPCGNPVCEFARRESATPPPPPAPLEPGRTEIWFEEATGSRIYMQPVTDGGHGFRVHLATGQLPAQSDYLRKTWHGDLLDAMQRVTALMGLVAGTWTRVP